MKQANTQRRQLFSGCSFLQMRMLALCWFAYIFAYLLRMNLSVAIPVIKQSEGYSNTQIGLLTSLFFLTYTIGQLLSGLLGDHLRSKPLLVTGLLLSACCNLGCAFSSGLPMLFACWILNGFAQSMLWGPLIRTLSLGFTARQLERVSFYMALSTITGYACSWGLASFLSERLGWRAAFWLPAVLVLLFAALLLLLFRSTPQRPLPAQEHEPGLAAEAPRSLDDPSPVVPRLSLFAYLGRICFPVLFLMAAAQGLVREGVGVWLPTVLTESGYFPADSLWFVLLVIPLMNLAGVLFVQKLLRRAGQNSGKILFFLYILITAAAALLFFLGGSNVILPLILMVLLLSVTYGTGPIFTSLIPFHLSAYGRVSLTAGLFDFSIYCGAALSGAISGALSDGYSWGTVYLFWLLAAAVGLLAAVAWFFFSKRGTAPGSKPAKAK